ncbi:phospholipase A2 [Streptomyces roseoverticillatus]|uniref:phospholipase A2 n=1 Tax=Streptomyces roseoverticillatus TaxID=66429 RepID=UPI00228660DE|nr:phospholipase A2 [Streptomyces roseoverticillatus]
MGAAAEPALTEPSPKPPLQAYTDKPFFASSMERLQSVRNDADRTEKPDWSPDGYSWAPDRSMGFVFQPPCRRHDFGYRNYKKQGRFAATTHVSPSTTIPGRTCTPIAGPWRRGRPEAARSGPESITGRSASTAPEDDLHSSGQNPGSTLRARAGRPESGRPRLGRGEFCRPAQGTGHQPSENTVRCHGFRATAVLSDMTCLIWVYSSNE